MVPEKDIDARYARVDEALRIWRQGDCVVGSSWFAHRIDPNFPLTEAAASAASGGVDLAEEEVAGLVVVSQTCDIVLPCKGRPYVEVCPLVKIDDSKFLEIERGYRPAFGFIPKLAGLRLVAHLDRIMTVEKALVAGWRRTAGCESDD